MRAGGFIATVAAAAALAAVPAVASAAPMAFSTPAYVDKNLHGGEPLLWEDPIHHTLLYTAHEGTTHLYRPGFNSLPGDFTFVSNYNNQVILWVSKDDGKAWTHITYQDKFSTDPTKNTGFSD